MTDFTITEDFPKNEIEFDQRFSNRALCARLHPHRLRHCRAFVFFRLWRKNPSHPLCGWSVTQTIQKLALKVQQKGKKNIFLPASRGDHLKT